MPGDERLVAAPAELLCTRASDLFTDRRRGFVATPAGAFYCAAIAMPTAKLEAPAQREWEDIDELFRPR